VLIGRVREHVEGKIVGAVAIGSILKGQMGACVHIVAIRRCDDRAFEDDAWGQTCEIVGIPALDRLPLRKDAPNLPKVDNTACREFDRDADHTTGMPIIRFAAIMILTVGTTSRRRKEHSGREQDDSGERCPRAPLGSQLGRPRRPQ